LDRDIKGTNCKSINSVLCDQYIIEVWKAAFKGVIQEGSAFNKTDKTDQEEDRQQVIAQTMYDIKEQDKRMLLIIGILQGKCIYCKLMFLGSKEEQAYSSIHTHSNCINTEEVRCSIGLYKKWQEGVDFG
jgi:hypothetical protein